MGHKLQIDTSDKFRQLTFREHVNSRSMWVGSHDPIDIVYPMYNIDNKTITMTMVHISPALLKLFDELIVNIIDHNQISSSVTIVKIEFDINGYISVTNNGKGISCKYISNPIDNTLIPIPTLVCTKEMAGSNFGADSERITGGVNGLGLTLVNVLSNYFKLTTSDVETDIVFIQECKDHMKIIETPIIYKRSTDIDKKHILYNGGTEIKYLPDYAKFGKPKDIVVLSMIISRVILASAYMNSISFYINNNLFSLTFEGLVRAVAKDAFYYITAPEHPKNSYPLEIGLIISDKNEYDSFSIINGIYVPGGFHIKYMKDYMASLFRGKIETFISGYGTFNRRTMIDNNIHIIIKGIMKGTEFGSQDKLTLSRANIDLKQYKFNNDLLLKKIWDPLKKIVNNNIEDVKPIKTRLNTSSIKGYDAASDMSKTSTYKRNLWVVEGLSAMGPITKALRNKETASLGGTKLNGIFQLGGVILNTYNESKRIYKMSDDKKHEIIPYKFMLSDKFKENKKIIALAGILKLPLTERCITQDSIKNLTYNRIIITTDQDVDGAGNICGLVLQHIRTFWPALIIYGHVYRLLTPLIKCFPRSKKIGSNKSFLTQYEFDKWSSEVLPDERDKYRVEYYKGLATHDPDEFIHIMKDLDRSLVKFVYDSKDDDDKTIDIFYGTDTHGRKELIQKGAVQYTAGLRSTVSFHLKTETIDYFLENSIRKLVHCLDGTRNSSIKMISYALLHNTTKAKKVFQMSGEIASRMQYHHGGESMCKVITNSTKTFVGSNNFTIPFIGEGDFGSRCNSGKPGSSRYIAVKNNPLLWYIFRQEDMPILTRKIIDGEESEFNVLFPIIPYFMCRKVDKVPANGWKYELWPRNINDVIDNIKILMKDGISAPLKYMRPWIKQWNGRFIIKNNVEYAIGTYSKIGSTIIINEIPPSTYVNEYVTGNIDDESSKDKKHKGVVWKGLRNLDGIKSVIDECSEADKKNPAHVKFHVELTYDGHAIIEKAYEKHEIYDAYESYFKLGTPMHHHLNMIDINNKLIAFKSYEELLKYWFSIRILIYKSRILRDITMARILIEYFKNKIRFINMHEEFNLSKLNTEEMEKILIDNKFNKFNSSLIKTPRDAGTTPQELISNLLEKNLSYDYLLSMSYKNSLNKKKKEFLQNEINKLDEKIKNYESHKDNYHLKIWSIELSELETYMRESTLLPV